MNVKFTRKDGTDCYSGDIKYEVGKEVTAPDWDGKPVCSGGLHFGSTRKCLPILKVSPGRVFEIEPKGKVVEIEPGKKKAKTLLVLKELDLNQVFIELLKDKDIEIEAAKAIVQNPNSSKEVLTILIKHRNIFIRGETVKNPNADNEIFTEAAKDENSYVRKIAAESERNNKEILAVQAKDEYLFVKTAVARNLNTSKETLAELAKDEDWFVRKEVTKRFNKIQ